MKSICQMRAVSSWDAVEYPSAVRAQRSVFDLASVARKIDSTAPVWASHNRAVPGRGR